MTNDDIRLWLPPMLTLLGTLIVVVFTAWLNTRAVVAKFEGQNERFASIDKRLDGLHENIREIRSDVKLLTGKVYEMMAQKG
jgi:hypothetical protein